MPFLPEVIAAIVVRGGETVILVAISVTVVAVLMLLGKTSRKRKKCQK